MTRPFAIMLIFGCAFATVVHTCLGRTWTDRKGRQVEAAFISFTDGKVTLKRAKDGKSFEFPLDQLSDVDQAFVRSQPKAGSTVTVVVEQAELRVPGKTLARLPKGTDLLVTRVQDDWVWGHTTFKGTEYSGWLTRNEVQEKRGESAADWIPRLIAEDEATRRRAVDALKKWGEAAVPALIARLSDNNPKLRKAAVSALGELGSEAKSAVPSLITALGDKEDGDLAALALAKIGSSAVRSILDVLEDKKSGADLHSKAWLTLQLMAPRGFADAAIPDLIEILEAKDSAAILVLGLMPNAGKALSAASMHTDPEVRRIAILGLVMIGHKSDAAVKRLLEASDDKDPKVREISLAFCAKLRDDAVRLAKESGQSHDLVRPLVHIIQSENADLRKKAAQLIAKIGAPCVVPLSELLNSNDEQLRQLAIVLLAEMGEPSLEVLTRALTLQQEETRIFALVSLKKIGKPALPTVLNVLKGSDPKMRTMAALVLKDIGADPGAVVPNLASSLNDTDKDVRIAAALALVSIGQPECVSPLTDALSHKDQKVRHLAAFGLGMMGSQAQAALPALTNAAKDENQQVREVAVRMRGIIDRCIKEPEFAAAIAKLRPEMIKSIGTGPK